MSRTRGLAAAALAGALALTVLPATADASPKGLDYTIDSPYASVDWSWNQYKSGFHNHTTESDGGNTLREMVTQAYELGFNVYAATDHNFVMKDWVGTYKRGPLDNGEAPDPKYYFSQAEVDALLAGEGRDGQPGLLGVPAGNEQSVKDHFNTFWADWNNTDGATLESKIEYNSNLTNPAGELQPIGHINHPGRYYGGSNTQTGTEAANDPAKVQRYVDIFNSYGLDDLPGMEIVNKVSDKDSYSDRILWDNVLAQTMPARNVFGFANDDAHSVGALGYQYNQLLMPNLSEEAVHNAMSTGAWYSTALVAKRELGADFKGDRTLPGPKITNIAVDERRDTITIKAANYTTIEWIADGKVIATGNTLSLRDHASSIDNYVRAQIKGDNGISFTNAFGIDLATKHNQGRFISDSQAADAALASLDRTTAQVSVKRTFHGRSKVFTVVVTTDAGSTTVRVDAETGRVL